MGRVITAEKYAAIEAQLRENPKLIGVQLGKMLIDYKLPVSAVAPLLDVSEITVYRWMHGELKPRKRSSMRLIKTLLAILRKAKKLGQLPIDEDLTGSERSERVVDLIRSHFVHQNSAM